MHLIVQCPRFNKMVIIVAVKYVLPPGRPYHTSLLGPTFFPLRVFLGILAHFSVWNLESDYSENKSEWFLIRIALDDRLISDIYMTFSLTTKNIMCLHNDPSTCMCVYPSRECGSFLYVHSVNTGRLHWRCSIRHHRHKFLPSDFCLHEIMETFSYVIFWFFLPFPFRSTIHLELTLDEFYSI